MELRLFVIASVMTSCDEVEEVAATYSEDRRAKRPRKSRLRGRRILRIKEGSSAEGILEEIVLLNV